MAAFNIWRESPPPRETWVWAKYKLVGDNWQIGKTCKRGCCISFCGQLCYLPKYWKDASADDVHYAQMKMTAINGADI